MAKRLCAPANHPETHSGHSPDATTSRAWRRRQDFWSADHSAFDIAIIGGGVQGACLYHQLVREGYRVLLLDRGDFGGGTSQASAMLVWGGLLYLKNFDLVEIVRLCAARDRLIQQHGQQVAVQHLAFLFGKRPHRRPWLVHAGLRLYWMLALGRRRLPARPQRTPERAFLRDSSAVDVLRFEEGHLRLSDAQFVYDWIDRAQGRACGARAINYCEATGGSFDRLMRLWNLDLRDTLEGRARAITARWIVNAAGVWADRVSTHFGIDSPWRHLLAKGASMTFARPEEHHDILVFDGEGDQEGMSLVPWGNVSLWGSTETIVSSPDEGWTVEPADVAFLLDSLNQHMAVPVSRHGIIALRCGLRPLVMRRGQAAGNPGALSKRSRVWRDPHRPWIGIYGGKLTGCQSVARRTAELLRGDLGPRVPGDAAWGTCDSDPAMEWTAGLRVPSARWCLEHRMCWTLEDYLRRRTNIAQWVPRGGLGRDDEHRPQMLDVARELAAGTDRSADDLLRAYERRIAREYDPVLGGHSSIGDLQ